MQIPRQKSISFESSQDTVLSRASFSPFHFSPFTFHQQEADTLVSQFITEASDWKILASMTAGGLAYRWGKMGVMTSRLGHVAAMPLRPISIAVGLGSEVTTFEFTNRALHTIMGEHIGSPLQNPSPITRHLSPNLWSWNGTNGWKESLLSDLITFGMLKGAGYLARETNVVLQHTFASTAMVAGHNLIETLSPGVRPYAPTLAEQFLHAEVTNIQLGVGMELLHGVAPGLVAFERTMDINLRVGAKHSALPWEGRNASPLWDRWNILSLQTATAGLRPLLTKEGVGGGRVGPGGISPEEKDFHLSLMTGGREPSGGEIKKLVSPRLLTEAEKKNLIKKFRPLFPPQARETYSEEILSRVAKTPSSLPDFYEKVLTAFSQLPNAGSKEQLYTASALDRVFSSNSLHSPTGSFDYVLFQKFVMEAVCDSDTARGNQALRKLFQRMERGVDRSSLENLYSLFGYDEGLQLSYIPPSEGFKDQHSVEAAITLHEYRATHQSLIFHFVHELSPTNTFRANRIFNIFEDARDSGRYSPEDIDRALERSQNSPWGRLILARLLQIFAVEDHSSKLKELLDESPHEETHLLVSRLLQEGQTEGQIARHLNGTRHTGYLDDMRLAHKVARVMQEIDPYLRNSNLREDNFDRLEKAFYAFVKSKKPLDEWVLMNLFLVNTNSSSDWIALAWRLNSLQIEVKNDHDFDLEAKKYKQPPDILAFIVPGAKEPKSYRFFLRDLPPLDLSTMANEWKAFFEVMIRLKSVAHEGEHWDHFIQYEDLIPRLSRHNRLLSEMMAYTEEYAWRLMNLENDFGEKAKRLGETPALHFRSIADQTYFLGVNDKLMDELFGEE